MKLLPMCLLPVLLCALFAASPIHSSALSPPRPPYGVRPPGPVPHGPIYGPPGPVPHGPISGSSGEAEQVVEVDENGKHHHGGHEHHHHGHEHHHHSHEHHHHGHEHHHDGHEHHHDVYEQYSSEQESIQLYESMGKLKERLRGMMHDFGLDCIKIPNDLREPMVVAMKNVVVSVRRVMVRMSALLQRVNIRGMMHEFGLDCIKIPNDLKQSMFVVMKNVLVSARQVMVRMRTLLRGANLRSIQVAGAESVMASLSTLIPDFVAGWFGGVEGSIVIRIQEIIIRACRVMLKYVANVGLPWVHSYLAQVSASTSLPPSMRSFVDGFNAMYEVLVTIGFVTPAIRS